jgi:nicotinic acid mononucleotide adenylyltransferase
MLSQITSRELRRQIKALHESPFMVCMVSAGATGEMVQNLWSVPGSSNTIFDATFLSHRVRTMRFLSVPKGEQHDFRFCSDVTALRLAAECYVRGKEAIEQEGILRPVVGVGMTATCKTDRPQKGAHRVHIALRTDRGSFSLYAEFDKETLDREQQGRLCDLLALNALLKLTGCGGWAFTEPGVTYPKAVADGSVVRDASYLVDAWRRSMLCLLPGGSSFQFDSVAEMGSSFERYLNPEDHIIFPGSYRPLHHGHLYTADLAAQMTQKQVVFQMTAVHPDKGIADDATLLARAGQFAYRDRVLLMREGALYLEKAKLLPGFSFIIGADAVYGLLNPKYYDGEQGVLDMLDTFQRLKTRFYVSARLVNGTFRTLEQIPIPSMHRNLFTSIGGRCDMSSTQRRALGAPES